jgi:hypothetical protein
MCFRFAQSNFHSDLGWLAIPQRTRVEHAWITRQMSEELQVRRRSSTHLTVRRTVLTNLGDGLTSKQWWKNVRNSVRFSAGPL